MIGFDYREMDDLVEMFGRLEHEFPKETDKFLKKAGKEQAKWIKKGYRLKTKKKTGNLLDGVETGKPYIYNKDEHQLRVYSKAPHAHLIESGHRLIKKDGSEMKGTYVPALGKKLKKSFVEGRRVVETERKAFEGEFYKMADEWIDEFLEVTK